MHIFKEGRQALLEFLRNLTPQILILSLALIAGNGLTAKCCDINNVKQTFIMFAFLAIWAAAVWANSSIFVGKLAEVTLIAISRHDDTEWIAVAVL